MSSVLARRPAERPTVTIQSGQIGGVVRATPRGPAHSFRSVPYAAPPVGPLRFAPPRPHEGWDGVRPAVARGPQAPQPLPLLPAQVATIFGNVGSINDEDCLRLDVHTPADAAADGGLPVLVWIHGGGFETGTASAFDGSALAVSGGLVVVSVGYRLGALGWANVHDVVGWRSGFGSPRERVATNLGLRDVLAALEWIRDNIAAFGGDPGTVTISGESAGGSIVSALLHMPRARGLFHRAIAQSGTTVMVTDRDDATRLARELCSHLGASREDPEALWEASVADVLRAQLVVGQTRPTSITNRPWLDGDLLPERYSDLLAATSDVPLLAGHNRDEHTFFRRLARQQFPGTRAGIALALDTSIGAARAGHLLSAYPDDDDGLTALGTDAAFAVPAQQHMERHARSGGTVYRYRLDYPSNAFGMGAFHGLDVLLLWPQRALTRAVVLGLDAAGAELSERMQGHWAHFAAHGTPDPGLGPEWLPYSPTAGGRMTMVFDRTDSVLSDPDAERRRLWGKEEYYLF